MKTRSTALALAALLLAGLLASGEIAPAAAARMTDRLVRDVGIEAMLMSWVVIDNHDIPRIATQVPDAQQRRLVQALQFTLPGAPNVYYGAEVGMTGGADPENRGPMRWDLVTADNPELAWMKRLIALRKAHRALRIGDYRTLESTNLLAFERTTDRVLQILLGGDLARLRADSVAESLGMSSTTLRRRGADSTT